MNLQSYKTISKTSIGGAVAVVCFDPACLPQAGSASRLGQEQKSARVGVMSNKKTAPFKGF